MRNLILPQDGGYEFIRRAPSQGYSMEKNLISPETGQIISRELDGAGLLEDLVELEPTDRLYYGALPYASMLHRQLNSRITDLVGVPRNHLPLFSVRVFESGENGTTIHRNDSSVTPWAIGVTLMGQAPFNVYEHSDLAENSVRSLRGDDTDPTPKETMMAGPGSGWILYTRDQLVPHASGLVESPEQRELIIFYRVSYMDRQ